MSIYKDNVTGKWRVVYRYTDWTGKTKQTSKRGFPTKREAQMWEHEQMLKHDAKLDMTFASFCEIYVEDKKERIRDNTWGTKNNIARTKILPYFGERKIAEIEPKDVIAWQNHLLAFKRANGKGYSASYLRKIHSQLSAIFNHAVDFYHLPSNPAQKAGNIAIEEYKEMLFWTKEEYLKFADVMMDKPVSYYAFEMLYWCGISRLLSYETVVSGAFEKTFENISSSLKKEPFDKYFLSQIKEWRLVLSEDIVKNNSTINQETLNIFVQKLINRIVFLRICEDRELEKYESLKNIGTYAELKKVFTAADKKYDSGLFELIDGEQFEIEPKSEEKGIIKFIDCNGRKQEIEAAITKPCIYDMQLEKYAKIEENRRIIFPYYQKGKKQILYSIDEMKQLFPKTLKYFESFKEELCKRSINNMSENNWYQFGRSQSLKRFVKGEHLVWSVLATQGNYVYDTRTICFTGGGNGPFYGLEKKDDTKESLFYIQAVLNYWMIEMIVKSKASKFRGDYYSHGKQFVAQLPIYRINFDDSNEVKIHDEIVDTVKNLMKLKNKRDEQQTKPQKETYERLIQIEDNKLDGLISKLYGAENCRREDLDEE